MRGKPLGDIRNVLFYTKEQKQLIDSLNSSSPIPTVIIGDYGTGKSVILDAAATKFATNGFDVHYVSALGAMIVYILYKQKNEIICTRLWKEDNPGHFGYSNSAFL